MKTQNFACNRRIVVVCVAMLAALMLGVSLLPLTAFARVEEGANIKTAVNAAASPTDLGRAYVAMSGSNEVAMIDTTTHTYLGSVYVGGSCSFPWRTTISPDEAYVYVSCEDSGNVVVISTASNNIIATIPNIPGADDITFVQGGSHALVGSRNVGQIKVIDTTTQTVINTIFTSSNVRSLAAHPYAAIAYATSQNGEILVIDTNTFAIADTVVVGGDPWDVAVSPEGQWVFAGDRWGAGMHVIDTTTNTLVTTIANVGVLTGLAVTPDGQKLFAGALYDGVRVFDIPTQSFETNLSISGPVWSTAVNCDGSELYVGNVSSSIPIIDTTTYSVTANVYANGANARSIAICPEFRLTGAVLLPAEQSNSGALGETVVHELTVLNATDMADSYDIVLGAAGWDTAVSTAQVGPLQPGQSVTITVSVTVPLSADWYDEDSVTIYATSVTSPSVYSDTAVAITQAYAPPQISVSPDNLTSTQLVNTLTTQTLTFNNGNGITGTFEFVTQRTNLAVAGSDSFQMTNILSSDPSLSAYQFTDVGDNYSLVTLQPYDAVILSEYDYGISVSEAAALRQYYESGHPIVLGMDDIDDLDPSARADLLFIFGLSSVTDGVFYPGTANQSHPIGNGITTLYSTDDGDNDRYEADDAVWVVQGNDGNYYVMAHDNMARTVVFGELLAAWWGNGNTQLIRNAIEWIAAGNLLDSWLTTSPISGTIPTNDSTAVTVTFNSYALQPGLYTQNLLVSTNQPDQIQISLPVSLIVEPTASMGWVEGTITDVDTGLPLEATIIAIGQPYTITSDANTGYYQFWLEAGSYTLQVSADGYVTETQAVSIVAQQGTIQDFDLVLNVPVIEVTHEDMAVAQDVGQGASRTFTITNAGPALLEFDILKTAAGYTPLAYVRDRLNLALPEMTDTTSPAPGPLANAPTAVHLGGSPVLIIQDYYPWGYDSIQQILSAYAIPYDQVDSSYMAMIDLAAYELVIIPSVQGSTFYNNWNAHIARFEAYVEAGGALWLSGTTDGYNSAVPGGVVNQSWYDNVNDVVMPSHPWVANVPGQIQGNSASQNYFTNLYPNSTVVAQATGNSGATLIDYQIGGGRIFLTGQTLEIAWAYGWNFSPILENSLLDMYVWEPRDVSWLEVVPISGTVAGYSSEVGEAIFDATGLQPGTYTANVIINNNDPVNGRITIPVTMTVSPAPGMGQVMGTVTDLWMADPLTATVQLVGVYTDTADPNYSIWADAGSHTLIASASGYMTGTYNITIPANGVVVQDIALEPAQPRLEDMPEELEITAVPGHTLPHNFTLANTGPLPLNYSWHEVAPELHQPETPVDLNGKVIMYDRAHGQGDLNNFTTLAAAINNAGGLLTVNFAFPVTANLLNNVDVLWVDCCGSTNWTFAELQVVNDWLEAGGAVLVHSENNPAAADVAGIYNITYQCCQYSYGTTTDILPHPTTAGVSAIYLDYSYDALNYTAAADVTVRDTNGYAQAVAQEQNGGKMVVIDSWLFNDGRINQADNMLFAMNVMNWLADPAYGDVPWLYVLPLSGDIAGHSTEEFTVMVDTTGLAVGTHEAVLALEHNDPAQESPLLLPVTVQVVEQTAAITLTPMTTSGSGLPGTPVTYTLTVQNSGNGPDTFAISVSSDWTATPSMVTTSELMPGQSQQFTVVVQIPQSAAVGSADDTAVTATSQFNNTITQTATLTTTAVSSMVHIYLPVILKP